VPAPAYGKQNNRKPAAGFGFGTTTQVEADREGFLEKIILAKGNYTIDYKIAQQLSELHRLD